MRLIELTNAYILTYINKLFFARCGNEKIFKAIALTGFLSTKFGWKTYVIIFEKYKLFLEGKTIKAICKLINKNSFVIDVGANFGVYTQAFIDGVGINGKVFAIEPEPKNLHTLKNRFSQQLKSGQLEVFEGIAASTPGDYCLSIHSCNPGGHVVSQSGMSVKGITIDQIVQQVGLKPSLIKIDVEGYEESVILGATKTISTHHPILYFEYHPKYLESCGTNAAQLLQYLVNQNYRYFLYGEKECFYEHSIEQVLENTSLKQKTVIDILAFPEAMIGQSTPVQGLVFGKVN
tara:strand:- start:252 stop:1124 length:873 start_codon:yes stop_codon:yes gene_type:complete